MNAKELIETARTLVAVANTLLRWKGHEHGNKYPELTKPAK